MITQEPVRASTRIWQDQWWVLTVGAVVVAVLATSLFSPDMITGSNQEHLPLAAFSDWIWGTVAVGYLAFIRRRRADMALCISVSLLWAAVAVTSIFAPELVTGTDPTRIPVAALVAPIVGAVVTGFLALNALADRER